MKLEEAVKEPTWCGSTEPHGVHLTGIGECLGIDAPGLAERVERLGEILDAKRVEVHAILGRDDRALTPAERTSLDVTLRHLSSTLGQACKAISRRDPEYTRGKCTLVLADAQRSISELHRELYLGAFEADEKEAPGAH